MRLNNYLSKLAASVFLASVCFLCAISAQASSSQKIELQIGNAFMKADGSRVEIDPGRGTAPVIVNGRTLVPIRSIIEALGGTVGWDGEKSEITLILEENEIKLTVDSHSAFLNGKESILDVAPAVINERTMLPVRYIAESFKLDVSWQEETETVTITKPPVKRNVYIVTEPEEDMYDDDFSEEPFFDEDFD